MEFENKMYEGIHYNRFVASWLNAGGTFKRRRIEVENFKDWLRSLKINGETIPEDVIMQIANYGSCGKLELETSAKQFLKSKES